MDCILKKSFVLLACCFLLNTMNAQVVPGYRGHKLMLGFSGSSFLVLEDFFRGGTNEREFWQPKITYKSEVSASYVVGRKINLGAGYYFGTQHYHFTGADFNPPGAEYYPGKERMKCSIRIYEIRLQVSRKDFIAPIGLYHEFAVGLVKYKLLSDDDSITVHRDNHVNYWGYVPETLKVKVPEDPFSGFKLSYYLGKNNAIGKLFYMNAAIGINLYVGGDIKRININQDDNYVLWNLNRKIRSYNFFEVKLGFGFLSI